MIHHSSTTREPNRKEAWEFMRKEINPRRVKKDEQELEKELKLYGRQKEPYRLAKKNETEEDELFPVWSSSITDLGMFGIGIGMYFKQILGLFWLVVLYGLISLPLMQFYGTPSYNDLDENGEAVSMPFLLPWSGACTSYYTVEVTADCPSGASSCTGYSAYSCKLHAIYALYDFIAISLMFIFVFYSIYHQKKEIAELDLEEQTPGDYAIVVKNPNSDADDPDEWKQFFSQFGEVAYVTISRKNRKLLKAVALRRNIKFEMFTLNIQEQEHISQNEQSGLLQPEKPGLCAGKTEKYWYSQLWKINKTIEELKKETYPVCKVYVVFNKEAGQRNCLTHLSTGKIPAALNMSFAPPEHRFRGSKVLKVEKAAEPSDILWQNLELSSMYLILQRFISTVITALLIYGCFQLISSCKDDTGKASEWYLGLLVTVLNVVLSIVLRVIGLLENHKCETSRQDSIFWKLVSVRFINTAILNWVTTTFHNTLSVHSLKNIQTILIVDAVLTPTIKLLDFPNTLKRFVISRWAKTHFKLLEFFCGSPWWLGERYSAYLKTFFVAIFYSALFPGGMFVAACAFTYGYWVDKYMLLRVWKKAPDYDAKLAHQARCCLLIGILCHLMVTAYWYFGWPFDTTVPNDEGGYTYQNKRAYTITDPTTWINFIHMEKQAWEDDNQRILVEEYSDAALALFFIIVGLFCAEAIWYTVKSMFFGLYEEIAEATDISYDSVQNIDTYVPLCFPPKNELAGPLIAAHCINLNEDHQPDLDLMDKKFEEQNVALEFSPEKAAQLFGIVKGYSTSNSPASPAHIA